MRNEISIASILKLDVSERIQLVEDVWDSVAAVPDAIPLTDKQKKELDQRLSAYHKNPSAGSPWKEVKKRILSKKGD
jgi:putative addiction module component (TIGR02574 family)